MTSHPDELSTPPPFRLSSDGKNFEVFLSQPDDIWVFTKGACHAFALELHNRFIAQGKDATLCYVSSADHERVAKHVFVKFSDECWDVRGAQSTTAFCAFWADSDYSRLLSVGNPVWISEGSHTRFGSYLGLFVHPTFLKQAKMRARTLIESSPAFSSLWPQNKPTQTQIHERT